MTMNMWKIPLLALPLVLFMELLPVASAAEEGTDFFEKKIRPVLVQHCYRCHSAGKRQRGGLSLDTKQAVLKGGDSGPALVPGHPEKSLLIKAIRYGDKDLQMPPKGKLPAPVIADLEKWIAIGAPDPRTGTQVAKKYGIDIKEGRKFWAFQPPKKQPLPKVKAESWCRGPVDRFILARLEKKGIRPLADADRVTLIRRAYFALIGLPPSPQQIDAFLKDKSPQAFAKVVDDLLASPHFGERWARHWLDVARYAESTGGGRSMLLPDAWRYRDYVIHAFNTDKPYNQFIKEQIAGDLMKSKTSEERYWRLVATAYLLLGPHNYELQDKPVLEMDIIDEQMDTMGRTFLGMTIGCARCHDHKFDPIPQKDYYALAGIFKSTKFIVHSNVSRWMERPLPVPQEMEAKVAAHEAAVSSLQTKIGKVKAELKKAGVALALGPLAVKEIPGIVIDDTQAKKVGKWSKSRFMNTFIGDGYLYSGKGNNTLTFVPKIEKDGFYEVRLAYLANPNRATNTPIHILSANGDKTIRINQRKSAPIDGRWISLGKYRFEKGEQWFVMVFTKGANGAVVADAVQFLHEDELEENKPAKKVAADTRDLRSKLKALETALKRLKKKAPKRPQAMAVEDRDKVGDLFICVRGNYHNKGADVPRGFLQVLMNGPMPALGKKESGRRQLAEWLASPKNPLTARVMVNRIWHHLFGCGIVKTVDNFGATGDRPSHPELLDYLALRFVEQNWSVKKLIREIMLSHAWQLTSQIDVNDPGVQRPLKADMENRLLWRQNRRRLEAEAIRDAMLVVSGQLDREMDGATIRKGTSAERDYKFTDTRRSIYTPIFRNRLLELFEVFDFPDPNLVKGNRAASTVAPQALFLLNNPFVIEQAQQAARKTLQLANLDDNQRIDYTYRTALGRLPTARERQLALSFIGDVSKTGTSEQRQAAWERFYQVLFSCIDFRYVN